MSGRPTADIEADLRNPDIVADVWFVPGDGLMAGKLRIEAAERLAELDHQVNVSLDAELTAYETELARIDALLPDGVSIEQLAALWDAVHNDDNALRMATAYPTVVRILRAVKP